MSVQNINRSLRLCAVVDEVEALSVKVGEHFKLMGVVWK